MLVVACVGVFRVKSGVPVFVIRNVNGQMGQMGRPSTGLSWWLLLMRRDSGWTLDDSYRESEDEDIPGVGIPACYDDLSLQELSEEEVRE